MAENKGERGKSKESQAGTVDGSGLDSSMLQESGVCGVSILCRARRGLRAPGTSYSWLRADPCGSSGGGMTLLTIEAPVCAWLSNPRWLYEPASVKHVSVKSFEY